MMSSFICSARLGSHQQPVVRFRARTIFTVLLLLAGFGCISEPPVVCTSDTECDDGLHCNGVETCAPDGESADSVGCIAGLNPCPEQAPFCIEDSRSCVQCLVDVDCDDGEFCNGAETCAENDCRLGDAPCGSESSLCNEDSDACLCLCESDADCDDGSFCNGIETCVMCACAAGENPCPDDGVFCNGNERCDESLDGCAHSGNPCDGGCCVENQGQCLFTANCPCTTDVECADDGVFCNGEEICSGDGLCIHSGDPCPGCPFGFCDEVLDQCLESSSCESNEDCPDDGLFCTGLEYCDIDGCCKSSGNPCDPIYPGSCLEVLNSCGTIEPPVEYFTRHFDHLYCAGGDFEFNGPLEFNSSLGQTVPTFGDGDMADGTNCNATLTADLNHSTPTLILPTLISVERLIFRDLGTATTTLDASEISGTESISFTRGTNPNNFVVTNLAEIVELSLSEQNTGVNLSYQSAATSALNDTMTITLDEFGGANATIGIATGSADGLEFLNLVADFMPSTISDIVMNGTSLRAINISGNAELTITNSLDANVTFINAASNFGGVNLKAVEGTGVTFLGSTRNDTFISGSGNDVIAGGQGDDTIEAGEGTDMLSGNAGADIFRIASSSEADRDVITDFNDTPMTGDRLNLDSEVATLSGTDNFASSASLQSHMTSGNLTIGAATEVAVVRSGVVANFTDGDSLTGTNLLTAIGGTITSPVPDGQFLVAAADAVGNVGIYFGDARSGDLIIAANELALITVFQGPNVSIAGLDYSNFSNDP